MEFLLLIHAAGTAEEDEDRERERKIFIRGQSQDMIRPNILYLKSLAALMMIIVSLAGASSSSSPLGPRFLCCSLPCTDGWMAVYSNEFAQFLNNNILFIQNIL